jgi:site-specific recombinase XerD
MDTRDWARAMRNLGKIEDPSYGLRRCIQPGCNEMVETVRCTRHTREIARAVKAYHDMHQDAAENTKRSRRIALRWLEEFTVARGLKTVDQIELEHLNEFRAARPISARTWAKELGTVRHFFKFCMQNDWILKNYAELVQMPRNLQVADREPYSPNEVARIIAACDQLGNGIYERLRARAMILLLRYTALRISDVATMERSRIQHGEIFVRTTKNGKQVRLPLHSDLQAALAVLPLPREADGPDCPYLFWSGHGSRQAFITVAGRSVAAVFEGSGVAGACSHRFRHTLATEVLEMGGTFEEAADILGDTETTVRKHYAKWSRGRQTRISDLLARLWHAKKPTLEVPQNEYFGVVTRVIDEHRLQRGDGRQANLQECLEQDLGARLIGILEARGSVSGAAAIEQFVGQDVALGSVDGLPAQVDGRLRQMLCQTLHPTY